MTEPIQRLRRAGGSPSGNILGAIFLLQRKNRTSPELQKLLGLHETTILDFLRRLEAEGLAERTEERIHNPGVKVGRKSIVWAWVKQEAEA